MIWLLNKVFYLLRPVLSALPALVFWLGNRLDRRLRKRHRSEIPVISVGNLTAGGNGKTPFTLWLAAYLASTGYKVAIISRGYRGSLEKTGGVVSDGHRLFAGPAEAGDEVFMLAEKLLPAGVGVFCGADRVHSCRRADEMGFNLALLDDGFQHYSLERLLDLVLIDPRQRYNGPLPLGDFRESPSALKRAQAALFVTTDGSPARPADLAWWRRYSQPNPDFNLTSLPGPLVDSAQKVIARNSEQWHASELSKRTVVLLGGIARPERFFASVQSCLKIHEPVLISRPDHHDYPAEELSRLATEYAGAVFITTEKDAVKLKGRFTVPPLFTWQYRLEPAEPDAFTAWLHSQLPPLV